MAIFAQVVDSGGFSAAARHLGVTTSAVSRHVARLEAHLGGRLLLRTTRALSLTELGQQVHAACARMLSTAREVHAMAGSYSARPNGVIRVSAPVVFGLTWLAPRLPDFLAQYPEVDVRLTLIDRTVDLAEDGVDLAIRIARDLSPGLAARPLCAMRYVLVASPAYLARHGAPAAPDDLPSHACCYLGYGSFGPDWRMKRGDEQVDIHVASRLTINNSAAIVTLAEAGGAIGLVPDFAARAALEAERLQLLLPDWEFDDPYTGSIHAVYTPGRHLALKVRALIDYLVQAV
ncbi:LysR family transcriptional regulator [Pseudoduganella sp. FT26W]|uniref:LysR family transcriptional regulator n=2 Tax=Duganella aquatilis TaxID=2666082 RepID=A0A844D5D1_9BURK|nr:LysR family transcriptional regulator [Duganella aquatilis]